ncbi:methyltransferase domain-containing protein [Engelhardtia mirabilis]|uniref:Thiopurine S-methyltransferase n=1 Tax=Engelhardtia mirabilis TaxID=2528011 RepID=A0A518BQF7_9BACT|nr:Thiopurine S-methyltransferase [Planctomycetes bacterium Pla133]QDV03529.1 Thiopurine S-methyltransferase [Planctomycetes bacterium Pla86]
MTEPDEATDERPGRAEGVDLREPSAWAERYDAGDTPWDCGGPHPEIARRIASGELAPTGGRRALVPGCGRGHDALALARAGWTVTAVDFAPGLAAELGPALAALGGEFVEANALEWQGEPVDLVLEHTFHCALPPTERPRWAALVARALRPRGTLAVLVFPADKPVSEGGPPHRTETAELSALLAPAFELVADEAVEQPLERRQWLERWARFRRTSDGA